MTSRSTRRLIAQETLNILDEGSYSDSSGQQVSLAEWQRAAVSGTVLYRPPELEQLLKRSIVGGTDSAREDSELECSVVNATTFAAARSLLKDDAERDVMCLNFASAKNPGGGFLGGSQAQEECLARASGLYRCIAGQREYYDSNRAYSSCLYTDHLIYSPGVPVFRDDDDQLLDSPWRCSIITSPAVNAGALRGDRSRIEPVMRQRIDHVLTVSAVHGHRYLVLGAWGCGVFRNDPGKMARWFHDALYGARFQGVFAKVVFGILDRSAEERFIGPFKDVFD